VGGSVDNGLGTWTGLIDDCNSTNSRNYREATFTLATGASASGVSAKGQTIDAGTLVAPALDTYSATFTFSGWTLNGDGTGHFTLADSSQAAGLPNGVYPFLKIGSTIVFGITNPGGHNPALPSTLDELRIFYLVKQ
jgi:hypothetical protein